MIAERLRLRQYHFMKAQMLPSQFADLEEPRDAIVVDVTIAPATTVRQILGALTLLRASAS